MTQRKHGLSPKPAEQPAQSPVEPRADHSGYFPNTEYLAPDEMRVVILGSGMPNPRKGQASASVLVELGNGDKFLFDCGSESMANLGSLEIPYDWVDKVFISHLHQDHFADLVALWIGGWTGGRHGPLRVWGPSGDKPELGTKAAVEGFQASMLWDVTSRLGEIPAGGGDLEVTEFDYRGENEVVYSDNGVTIRSFPAVHAIDGSVSYALEWNGLKFVFGGDTYPNKWFVEYAQGADLAIHECFPTMDQLVNQYRFDPATAINVAIHVHTSPSAFGAVMDRVKPRMAVAWHFYNDFDTRYDVYEQIRSTYDGPLAMGDDLLVFNITKDSMRVREAIVNPATWPAPPASRAEAPDHSLLIARSEFIDSGALVDLVDEVVGPEVVSFKAKHGVE
ncbi:MAG: MBL fold metallo-hydrolase [Actinomycetota bacterium]|nr:MBL fold metallo-hydrolase [Actinomycetota bacterium]